MFADWDTVTEEDAISADASVHAVIVSQRRTGNLDFGYPDCDKQMRMVTVVYRDKVAYSGETIVVKYRIDQAESSSLPSWTTLGTITSAETNTLITTSTTNLPFTGLSAQGKFFQFQVEANDHLEVMALIFYYDVLPKTYN